MLFFGWQISMLENKTYTHTNEILQIVDLIHCFLLNSAKARSGFSHWLILCLAHAALSCFVHKVSFLLCLLELSCQNRANEHQGNKASGFISHLQWNYWTFWSKLLSPLLMLTQNTQSVQQKSVGTKLCITFYCFHTNAFSDQGSL